MNNQLFVNRTFAEIYATTPAYMHGTDEGNYNSVYLGTVEYAGKPTDVVVVWDGNTDTHCLVLVGEDGFIL